MRKRILVIESLFRELGFNQQALYCYTKLYSLDPDNVDALWDRATLAREMHDLRTVGVSSSSFTLTHLFIRLVILS